MHSISVLGGGESGIGAALLAKSKGINVFVSDFGLISKEFKSELIMNNIPFEEGGHDFEKIDQSDLIVKSPGIPEKSGVMQHFRLRNKMIISEIEFAFKFYSGKIAAITGSNGKTTTTSLTYQILKESNLKVGLGGNIGYSFARLLSEDLEYDWIILELSSFQLEDIYDFQADVTALLNITPDHLDRYDYNFDLYAKAKWKLPSHTRKNGLVILNEDDKTIKDLLYKYPVDSHIEWLSAKNPKVSDSKDSDHKFEMHLVGKHNVFNASVARTIADFVGLKKEQIAASLKTFMPLEHRMEVVANINNILFINDSKATNLDSAEVALNAFDSKIIWIAGGTDKGNDYYLIKDLVLDKVKAIICLCLDDTKLRAVFENEMKQMWTTQNMEEAVNRAFDFGTDGEVVLLSPACASFDLFDNYEHRGREYKKAVLKLLDDIDQ